MTNEVNPILEIRKFIKEKLTRIETEYNIDLERLDIVIQIIDDLVRLISEFTEDFTKEHLNAIIEALEYSIDTVAVSYLVGIKRYGVRRLYRLMRSRFIEKLYSYILENHIDPSPILPYTIEDTILLDLDFAIIEAFMFEKPEIILEYLVAKAQLYGEEIYPDVLLDFVKGYATSLEDLLTILYTIYAYYSENRELKIELVEEIGYYLIDLSSRSRSFILNIAPIDRLIKITFQMTRRFMEITFSLYIMSGEERLMNYLSNLYAKDIYNERYLNALKDFLIISKQQYKEFIKLNEELPKIFDNIMKVEDKLGFAEITSASVLTHVIEYTPHRFESAYTKYAEDLMTLINALFEICEITKNAIENLYVKSTEELKPFEELIRANPNKYFNIPFPIVYDIILKVFNELPSIRETVFLERIKFESILLPTSKDLLNNLSKALSSNHSTNIKDINK